MAAPGACRAAADGDALATVDGADAAAGVADVPEVHVPWKPPAADSLPLMTVAHSENDAVATRSHHSEED